MTEELSVEQKLLIETQVGNNKKSTGVSYLLWFFVGVFGGHNFYLGRTKIAIAQLIICVIALITMFFGVGVFIYGVLGIWVLIEAFFIPGWIREDMDKQREAAAQAL